MVVTPMSALSRARFEMGEESGIDGTVAREQLLDFSGEFGARFADRLFEPFEQSGLGFSEKRDHVGPRTSGKTIILAEVGFAVALVAGTKKAGRRK